MSDNYLFNERPLVIRPELATKIGLNESIFLQQLNYWLQKSNHNIKGKKWIYNTFEEWKNQFPFWSLRTIKRIKTSLENKKIIEVSRYNKRGFDKTNWYSINYDYLDKLVAQRECQNGTSMMPNCHDGECQVDTTNTIDYTESTTEITTSNMSSSNEHDHSEAKEIIAYLNDKADKHFRNTQSNYKIIEARLKDYSIDDLKRVIDNKCSQWLNTNMDKYLRIETLFRASKIDGYLNEKVDTRNTGGEVHGIDF
ncbi:hypothetical protein AKUH4B202J_08890 [Apilactobacillus kunkeei]|nr:hypothetical protein AKUH4B202J_08890 [Apilactobacillus kunkeei]CAI2614604.1 hypothetical protein AKUH4B204J_09150 [Apilactobacillus kunkeei]